MTLDWTVAQTGSWLRSTSDSRSSYRPFMVIHGSVAGASGETGYISGHIKYNDSSISQDMKERALGAKSTYCYTGVFTSNNGGVRTTYSSLAGTMTEGAVFTRSPARYRVNGVYNGQNVSDPNMPVYVYGAGSPNVGAPWIWNVITKLSVKQNLDSAINNSDIICVGDVYTVQCSVEQDMYQL